MYKKLLSTESKKLISGIKISSLLIQFTFLVFPLSMYIVYNKVIASKNPNTLLIILIFLLTVLIIQLILKIAESVQHNILKTDEEITNQKQYINEKLNFNDPIEISNLQNKNDIIELSVISSDADKDIQTHISKAYLIFLIIYLFLIALIGKFIIIVPIIFFSINYLFARTLSEKQNEHNEKYKKYYAKKRALVREILQKIKVIKGLSASKNIFKKYKDLTYIINAEKCGSLYIQSTILKFSMVINIVNIAFILLLGRYLFSIGILNIEQIITCSLMTVWISRPMAQLFQNINNIRNKSEKTKNTNRLYNTSHSQKNSNNSEYKKIIQSIDKCLITYYKPNKEYSLKNFYQTYINTQISNKTDIIPISYINENFKLFYGSVIDNITMFDNSKQNEAKNLMEAFNLDYLINNLPYHYNYVTTGNQDESLSFDLKIGIEIIRELIRKPSLLIIDIDENRMNRHIVNGLKKHSSGHNIKLVCLKSDKNINKSILEFKKLNYR